MFSRLRALIYTSVLLFGVKFPTRAEMTLTFNGEDFGNAFLALATDLPNACLVVDVGVTVSLFSSTEI